MSKYNREDLNALKFKAQLIDIYIQGLFPKKFFVTYIHDHIVNHWLDKITNPRNHAYYYDNVEPNVEITFKYLKGLVKFDVQLTLGDLDKEITDVNLNTEFNLSELKDICTYRNNICKLIAVPSKCSVNPIVTYNYSNSYRTYRYDGVSILKNGVRLDIKRDLVIVNRVFSKTESNIFNIDSVKKEFKIEDFRNVSDETISAIKVAIENTIKIKTSDKIKEFRDKAIAEFESLMCEQ